MGRFFGSRPLAALIAVCTSSAAPSMLRARSNCSVIERRAEPAGGRHLRQAGDGGELLLQRRGDGRGHGLRAWRRATYADTTMVGKSTFGSAAIGSSVKVAMPNTRMPAISSAVAIGRRMKISEMFIAGSAGLLVGGRGVRRVSIRTLTLLASRYWPSTTTFSPAARPLAITASPSCRLASCTSRRCTVSSGRMT